MIGRDYIFIDIPKCATSSIISQLQTMGDYIGPVHDHCPLVSYIDIYGAEYVGRKTVFSVVRHPIDRIHSIWKYYNKLKCSYHEIDPEVPTAKNDPHRLAVLSYLDRTPTFDKFIQDILDYKLPERLPEFIRGIGRFPHMDVYKKSMWSMLNPIAAVDYILKFEHLDEDWHQFCDIMNWDQMPLPHSNSSRNTDAWEDLISTKQLNSLRQKLKFEFHTWSL